MTPKEQLREKFVAILDEASEGQPHSWTYLADPLMAAVEEVMSQPVHITIKPSDEQLELLREAIRKDTATLIYGDPAWQPRRRFIDNTVFDERTYGDEEC